MMSELSAHSWEFWWEHNRDSLLAEAAHQSNMPSSGSSGQLTGRGRRLSHDVDLMPVARNEVIGALQELLRSEDDPEICDSATLALARVALPDAGVAVGEGIRRGLMHETLSVKTSAALSLGVLGTHSALPLLNGLMTDSSVGRHAIGGGRTPWQVRCYAALSLGLINDPLAVEPLIDLVMDAPAADRELRVAAVTALGLMDNAATPAAVQGLLTVVEQEDIDSLVRAHAVTSLGRIRDPTVLPHLIKLYDDSHSDDSVRQSISIAFGRLAGPQDTAAISALIDALHARSDAPTREFGLVALARIAARCGQDPLSPQAKAIGRVLRKQVSRPDHRMDRSWAALASALYARSAGPEERELVQDVLMDEYDDTNDPSVRAAVALGLGLMDARIMAPKILEDMRASTDDAFRGYAAVGLGLLGHKPASNELIAMCTDASASDTLRLQAVRALGLMRNTEFTPVLLAALAETPSLDLAWSLGRALGQVRDPDSVAPLLRLAEDRQRSTMVRAFSCVALGLIGEKNDLRFNTQLQEDYNYIAPVTILNEVVNL